MCKFTLALRKLMILLAVFMKDIPMSFFSFVDLFYLLSTVDMVALDCVSSSAKKNSCQIQDPPVFTWYMTK